MRLSQVKPAQRHHEHLPLAAQRATRADEAGHHLELVCQGVAGGEGVVASVTPARPLVICDSAVTARVVTRLYSVLQHLRAGLLDERGERPAHGGRAVHVALDPIDGNGPPVLTW